jgi:predicted MFS family arabinose efflux permease
LLVKRLSKGISDEPESGGGLMVGTIRLSIMAGGGALLDRISITAMLVGGSALLLVAPVVVGNERKLQPVQNLPIEIDPRYAV